MAAARLDLWQVGQNPPTPYETVFRVGAMTKTPTSRWLFLLLAAAGCADGVDVDAAAASATQAISVIEPPPPPAPPPSVCLTLSRQNGFDVEDSTLARGANRGAALTLETDTAKSAAMQFDLSALPDAINVESATLVLNCRDVGKVGPARRPGSIKRVTRAWAESTVTQTQLQNGVAFVPAGSIPLPNTNKQFAATRSTNLSALVTDWKRNPDDNHGVVVEEAATKGSVCHSAEAAAGGPALEVCFSETNECADSPCFAGVECTDLTGPGTACGPCPVGFSGDGITCVSDTTCEDEPCGEGVKCRDLDEGGFQCLCPAGFFPGPDRVSCELCPEGQTNNDGLTCEPDGCFEEPCFPGVSCEDAPGPTGFVCGACPPGFVGDGFTCTAAPPPPQVCPPGTIGVFPACTPIFFPCPPGFVGVPPACSCPGEVINGICVST